MRHRSLCRDEQYYPEFNVQTRFLYGLTRGYYLYIVGVKVKKEIYSILPSPLAWKMTQRMPAVSWTLGWRRVLKPHSTHSILPLIICGDVKQQLPVCRPKCKQHSPKTLKIDYFGLLKLAPIFAIIEKHIQYIIRGSAQTSTIYMHRKLLLFWSL